MSPTEDEMRQAMMTQGAMFYEIQRLRKVKDAALVLAREDPTIHDNDNGKLTRSCFYCDGPVVDGDTLPLNHDGDCPYVAFWETLREPFDYNLSLDEVKRKALKS
jgi:hypothetical protein